jgi:hypothetical protein
MPIGSAAPQAVRSFALLSCRQICHLACKGVLFSLPLISSLASAQTPGPLSDTSQLPAAKASTNPPKSNQEPFKTQLQPVTIAPLPERRPPTQQVLKPELLARLKLIQNRLTLEINALEEAAKKRLQDSAVLSLKEDLAVADKKILKITEQLTNIDQKRSELLARREFIDQLVLAIDAKWNGSQPLQAFLEFQLLDMAQSDLTNPRGSGPLWKFITYLSMTVREVPEPREDVIGVMESYMNFASVLKPKTPAEFLTSRSYSNGSSSVAARPVDRSTLGDHLEKRMKELNRVEQVSIRASRGADLELRMKVVPPPASAPTEPIAPPEIRPNEAKEETKTGEPVNQASLTPGR